jgi:hypothetical protein
MEEERKAREFIPIAIELIEKRTQDKVKDVEPVNMERQFLITTDKNMKYLLVYKRNFFMSFGRIFSMRGIGESLNEEIVEYAISKGIHELLFVYKDGMVYAISPQEFKDYATNHKTIRQTASGELTMSIVLSILRRWK